MQYSAAIEIPAKASFVDSVKISELIVGGMNIVLLACSFAVWASLFQKWRSGKTALTRQFRERPARVGFIATLLTLRFVFISLQANLAAFTSPPAMPPQFSSAQLQLMLTATLQESLVVLPVMFLAVYMGARSQPELIRLGFRSDHLAQQIKEGVIGFFAAVLPVFALLLATLPFRGEEPVHPFLQLLQKSGFGQEMAIIFLTAAVLAPLKEELIFRVVFQSWLTRWLPVPVSILLSSLVFAAVHGFPDSIPLIPLAIILGTVYHYRRSYLTIVVIHALFNLSNLVQMVISTQ